MRTASRLLFSISLFLSISAVARAAEEKPAPRPSVVQLTSPAGPRAVGAALTTAPDGTLWLTWVEPSAPAAKKSSPPTPNRLRFATYDAPAQKWSAPRTIAERTDLPASSGDFPQLVHDGRGTATVVWTDGRGGALVTTSSDRGATWSSPAPWTHAGHGVEKFSFVRLADGRVLAAWLENRTASAGPKPAPQQLYSRILPSTPPTPSAPSSPSSHSPNLSTDTLVDASVCDCCPTALTAFPDGGALLAYRGRTDTEVRDIRTARFRGTAWDEARLLNNDDWRINACPMNGPRLANDGGRVAAVWFTAADNDPRILASYSPDAGARFLLPLRLDETKPAGYVDTLILRDGAILVVWLGADGGLWLRRITPDFATDEPFALAPAGTVSTKTMPRVALIRDYAGGTSSVQFMAAFATDTALRTLLVTVPEGELLTAKGNCDCAPTPDQLMGYSIRGAAAAISPERGTLHILHDELPGLLFAGTHEFRADPSVLASVKLGRRLFGRIEQRAGQWWLFDVRLAQ